MKSRTTILCMAAAMPLLFASNASAGLGPNLNPTGLDADPAHVINEPPVPPPTSYQVLIQYRRGHVHHHAH